MNWFWYLGTLCCFMALSNHVVQAASTTNEKSSSAYSTHTARRERSLDHWNADTLAYYLGIDPNTGLALKDSGYVGIDAAVLLYAQWCRNCHALAPSWDAIATHLHAGTVQSNLIMALFDCELNHQHMKLCSAAGVKHYPTLLYIGAGPYHDTDVVTKTIVGKDKSAGPAGAAALPRTVKFQGNWQYPDSVLDWVRLMQGLSKWHYRTTHGVLRFLREGLWGFVFSKTKKSKSVENTSLPVGIPMASSSSSTMTATTSGAGTTTSTTPASNQDTALLESKLKDAKDETKRMTKLATQASVLINSVLFPESSNTTDTGYVDVFAEMTNNWNDTTTPQIQVLKSCISELAIDYCTRLTTKVATDYVDQTPAHEIPTNITEIEVLLVKQVQQQEFYCGIIETCFVNGFSTPECRAPTCPFAQDVACRYLSACMVDTIQTEYGIALGYLKEGETMASLETKPQEKTNGGWGVDLDKLKAEMA